MYSIGLYFDQETDAIVRNVWKLLAEKELASYYHQSGNRPHITLGIFVETDLPQAKQQLEGFSRSSLSFPLVFQQIGLFPGETPTVFWGPAMTPQLLQFHKFVYFDFCRFSAEPDFDYYKVGRWIPHIGLAMEITDNKLILPIINLCQQLPNPHRAWVEEIGLISFRPVEQIFCYKIPDSAGKNKN